MTDVPDPMRIHDPYKIVIRTQGKNGFVDMEYHVSRIAGLPVPPVGSAYPEPGLNVGLVPHPVEGGTTYVRPYNFPMRYGVSKHQIARELTQVNVNITTFKNIMNNVERHPQHTLPIMSQDKGDVLTPSLYRQIRDLNRMIDYYVVVDHSIGAVLAIDAGAYDSSGILRTAQESLVHWRKWIDVQRRRLLAFAATFRGPRFEKLWEIENGALRVHNRLVMFWNKLSTIKGPDMDPSTKLPMPLQRHTYIALFRYWSLFLEEVTPLQAMKTKGVVQVGSKGKRSRRLRKEPEIMPPPSTSEDEQPKPAPSPKGRRSKRQKTESEATPPPAPEEDHTELDEIAASVWTTMEPKFCEGQADCSTKWDPIDKYPESDTEDDRATRCDDPMSFANSDPAVFPFDLTLAPTTDRPLPTRDVKREFLTWYLGVPTDTDVSMTGGWDNFPAYPRFQYPV